MIDEGSDIEYMKQIRKWCDTNNVVLDDYEYDHRNYYPMPKYKYIVRTFRNKRKRTIEHREYIRQQTPPGKHPLLRAWRIKELPFKDQVELLESHKISYYRNNYNNILRHCSKAVQLLQL